MEYYAETNKRLHFLDGIRKFPNDCKFSTKTPFGGVFSMRTNIHGRRGVNDCTASCVLVHSLFIFSDSECEDRTASANVKRTFVNSVRVGTTFLVFLLSTLSSLSAIDDVQ